jgi:hypothetical protein
MAKRTRFPLSSFDPRFEKLLHRGSLEPFTIRFDDPKKAKRFQIRINTFRSRFAKEKGEELAAPLYRCRVSLPAPGDTIHFTPQDNEFKDVFESLDLEPDAVADPKKIATDEDLASLDDMFDELGSDEEHK